jgi:hypothetical protein
MRKLLAVVMLVVLALIWLMVTAADASTVQIANALVVFLTIIVLPIVLRFVKISGPLMAAITYAASFAIAAIAAFLSGELQLSQLSAGSTADLFVFVSTLYAVQQLVFQMIKDHPVAGALVK